MTFFSRLLLSVLSLGVLVTPGLVRAQVQEEPREEIMTISSFVRDDCKHCQDQEAFFEQELAKEYPDLTFAYYHVENEEIREFMAAIAEKYGLVMGTPITLVRNRLIAGFDSPETTGARIRAILDDESAPFITMQEALASGNAIVDDAFSQTATCADEGPCLAPQPSYRVTIPLVGSQIDVGSFSLAAMSLVLGLVDGFNPCALWVLIMFLVVLSQLGSKKKMWQYAGIFILAEAIMYYGILTVWLTAWDFIGLNNIVTPLIGLLALGSGCYFLYKFYTYTPVCSVASPEQQKKISGRVKELAAKPMTVGVFFGILFLAFSVNIFEFACSIGIPQTFTKVLELNGLDWLGRQWYMFLYILMYMIDDVIVFGIALWSMEKIGVTHKYSKWATLIGGLAMLLLGFLMLWKPEVLVF